MGEHPYVDYMCLEPLVRGLGLMWMPVMSFLRASWLLLPWEGVWLVVEELEPMKGLRWDFLSAQWLASSC